MLCKGYPVCFNMLTYFGKSDIGKKRSNNQDTFDIMEFSCGAVLAVVCDGMGGARGGKEAASIAVSTFVSKIKEKMADVDKDGSMSVTGADIVRMMSAAATFANAEVYKKAKASEELSGMGTTLVAALIYEDFIYVANIGDSRIYVCEGERIEQITHDHSYVQYLVDMGIMSREDARNAPNKNIITRAVGIEKNVEADVSTVSVPKAPNSAILLCSDGLSGPLDEDEIYAIISRGGTPKKLIEELIDAANEKSGSDNITAVLVKPKA